MKIYIDFDGTLFDSTKQYQRFINLFKKQHIDEDYIRQKIKQNPKKYRNFNTLAKEIIEEFNLNIDILDNLKITYSKDLIFDDVIPFLEKYYKKYDLYLLTLGDKEYQEKKITSSNISKYFKDIIITNEDKSKLDIEYNKGIFIDNNPKELKKFYDSNVAHLIRIKRDTDKYSKLSLIIDNIPEFKDFEELSKSKYIEKIGENNYE